MYMFWINKIFLKSTTKSILLVYLMFYLLYSNNKYMVEKHFGKDASPIIGQHK